MGANTQLSVTKTRTWTRAPRWQDRTRGHSTSSPTRPRGEAGRRAESARSRGAACARDAPPVRTWKPPGTQLRRRCGPRAPRSCPCGLARGRRPDLPGRSGARTEGADSGPAAGRGSARLTPAPGTGRERKWPRGGGSAPRAPRRRGYRRPAGPASPVALRALGTAARASAAAPQPSGPGAPRGRASRPPAPTSPAGGRAGAAQSHRPRPRCQIAAQAARSRSRSPPRSPLFAGLAATKWR